MRKAKEEKKFKEKYIKERDCQEKPDKSRGNSKNNPLFLVNQHLNLTRRTIRISCH